MGLFRRNKSSSDASGAGGEDYGDVEGLIVNIGVIQALVMSFIVAMQMTVLPRTLTDANFLGLLCSSKDFRTFAVHTLESYDHPDYGVFNFTQSTGDGVLDIKQFLLVDCEQEEVVKNFPTTQTLKAMLVCGEIPEMMGSFEAMRVAFPMEKMNVWHAFHKNTMLTSNSVLWFMSVAAGFNFGGLFISVLLYISLSLSPAHEDPTGAALKAWRFYAMWLAIGDIILLAIALTFFSFGMSWNATLSSADWKHTKAITLDLTFSFITAPLTGVGGIVGIVAFLGSYCTRRKQLQEGTSEDAAGSGVREATV